MLGNINLKTKNYKLSNEQLSFVTNKIDSLSRKMPYKAQIKLVISYNKNKRLQGNLIVFSKKKTFYASGDQTTLEFLIQSLSKKMTKQIRKWKEIRTHEDITGIIKLPASESQRGEFKKAV